MSTSCDTLEEDLLRGTTSQCHAHPVKELYVREGGGRSQRSDTYIKMYKVEQNCSNIFANQKCVNCNLLIR